MSLSMKSNIFIVKTKPRENQWECVEHLWARIDATKCVTGHSAAITDMSRVPRSDILRDKQRRSLWNNTSTPGVPARLRKAKSMNRSRMCARTIQIRSKIRLAACQLGSQAILYRGHINSVCESYVYAHFYNQYIHKAYFTIAWYDQKASRHCRRCVAAHTD